MAVPTMREKCPFIAMFLKGKSSLFVTQYLPDIVELQQRLGENFQHRLSKREAKSITIEDFLGNLKEFLYKLRFLCFFLSNISLLVCRGEH